MPVSQRQPCLTQFFHRSSSNFNEYRYWVSTHLPALGCMSMHFCFSNVYNVFFQVIKVVLWKLFYWKTRIIVVAGGGYSLFFLVRAAGFHDPSTKWRTSNKENGMSITIYLYFYLYILHCLYTIIYHFYQYFRLITSNCC